MKNQMGDNLHTKRIYAGLEAQLVKIPKKVEQKIF